jgi:hypothetical protein
LLQNLQAVGGCGHEQWLRLGEQTDSLKLALTCMEHYWDLVWLAASFRVAEVMDAQHANSLAIRSREHGWRVIRKSHQFFVWNSERVDGRLSVDVDGARDSLRVVREDTGGAEELQMSSRQTRKQRG